MGKAPDLLKEVRDDVKLLREDLQELRTELAVYKAQKEAHRSALNWVMFTVMPAIGSALSYIGVKVGIVPLH